MVFVHVMLEVLRPCCGKLDLNRLLMGANQRVFACRWGKESHLEVELPRPALPIPPFPACPPFFRPDTPTPTSHGTSTRDRSGPLFLRQFQPAKKFLQFLPPVRSRRVIAGCAEKGSSAIGVDLDFRLVRISLLVGRRNIQSSL
jgi:hypothetical protein